MRKTFTALILMWVLVLGLVTTGCPRDSKTALEEGFAASVRASSYGTDFVKGVTQLHNDGALSDSAFNSIIVKMKVFGVAGRKINDALAAFVVKYPDGNIPPGEFSPLALIFNSDMYLPVLDIASTLFHLSPANQAIVAIAMAGLKTALNTIKRLMDRHSAFLGLPPVTGGNYVTA